MPHVQFEIMEDDTDPAVEGIVKDGFDSPVNLTGATVTFKMRLAPAGAVKIAAGTMGAVGDATLGRQKYSWAASDTDTPGTYEAQVKVVFANGNIRTFPPSGYVTVEVGDAI